MIEHGHIKKEVLCSYFQLIITSGGPVRYADNVVNCYMIMLCRMWNICLSNNMK